MFNTVSFTDGERDNFAAVVGKFDQYCTPRVNETYERYAFRTHLQHEGETIEQYVIDLKHKAKTCNYGILEESLIRDQIRLRTLDLNVKAKLLYNGHSSIFQASEVAKRQIQAMTDGVSSCTVTVL